MRRRDLIAMALGFLAGAAGLAGSQEDHAEMREQLHRLRAAAARLAAREGGLTELPPQRETGLEMDILNVRDVTMGVPDFYPPSRGLRDDGDEVLFSGVFEEAPQPYGTIEELMELVRCTVWPESYEEGAMMTTAFGRLFLFNGPEAIADTRKFLEGLRRDSHRSVVVELEAVDVAADLFRTLQSEGPAALSAAQRSALNEALAKGAAVRAFHGRATGLVGQRFLLWHGAQVACLSHADVEVAQGSTAVDPAVEVAQAGGCLSVRASVGDDPDTIHLDLTAWLDALEEPMEQRSTAETGTLDLPALRGVAAESALTVPAGAWVPVGGGAGEEGRTRLLLVRSMLLPRGGAR